MTNKFQTKWLFIISLVFSLAVGCSKSSNSSDEDDDTSTIDITQAAVNSVGDALQKDSVSTFGFNDVHAMTNQCSTVSFGSCTSGIKTRDFTTDGCTRTNQANTKSVTVYGSVALTYDDSACAYNVGNFFTRSLSNHYVVGTSGYKVLSYTSTGTVGGYTVTASNLKDYEGVSRSGGTVVTKTSTGYNVVINGIHRRGVKSTGRLGFWHTIYTPTSGLIVTTGSSHSVDGTVYVAHNYLNKTVITTFTNVVYPTDGSCCYPTSGSVTQSVVNEASTTVVFTSCGSVVIDGTSAELPACGGSSGT